MKHKIFATQQMAHDLLREAVAIWRQGNKSDALEGIEKDPIVSLLITALAYQECESSNEIEQLKNDIYQDVAQLLVPHHANRPVPACVLLQTSTESNVDKVQLNTQAFPLAHTDYNFLPLLHTTVYNANLQSVVRMDGRRWKVTLQFNQPVTELNGLTFLVDNNQFKDLTVTYNDKELSLIKPWEYAELPLSDYFSLETMLYNQTNVYDASATWLDLFAQHNKRLFVVQQGQLSSDALIENNTIDLVFEFFWVNEQFAFNKQQLKLNVVPLVNATKHSVTLTPQAPIARIAGSPITDTDITATQQFLHIMPPAANQAIYERDNIVLRRAAVERFNVHNLFKLTRTLLDKYTTDFYGFLQAEQLNMRMDVDQIRATLGSMLEKMGNNPMVTTSGLYVMLQDTENQPIAGSGILVDYITSNGSSVNKYLNKQSCFITPVGITMKHNAVIGDPIPGYDEVNGEDALTMLSKYYMITHDRIVTPADVKILCYKELDRRYQIASTMIESISVKRVVQPGQGRVLNVNIQLINDIFVKRAMAGKCKAVELLLEKMIEVRSTDVLPVHVKILVES